MIIFAFHRVEFAEVENAKIEVHKLRYLSMPTETVLIHLFVGGSAASKWEEAQRWRNISRRKEGRLGKEKAGHTFGWESRKRI